MFSHLNLDVHVTQNSYEPGYNRNPEVTPEVTERRTNPFSYNDDEVTGIPTIVRSKKRNGSMPTIEIEDLQGRSFLYEEEEDGSRHSHHPEMIKLRFGVQNQEFDELVAYNNIIRYIDDDSTSDGSWKFREILDHEVRIRESSERYNGSTYNILIEWENGEKTWEPLKKHRDG
jgi:hypothetical protein